MSYATPSSPCPWQQLLTVENIRKLFPAGKTVITPIQEKLISNSSCLQRIPHLYRDSFSRAYKLLLSDRRCQEDGCKTTAGGSYQTDVVLCSLGSWLYHQIGFDIVATFAQQNILSCKTSKRDADRFVALLIVFLEWRVRPVIHDCDHVTSNIIRTPSNGSIDQRLADVIDHISRDPHALSRFQQAKINKKWFQEHAWVARSIYYEYERDIIACLIEQLLQEIAVLEPARLASTAFPVDLQLGQFVRYNETVRQKLNVSPDSPKSLTDLFVPPPLTHLDPITKQPHKASHHSFVRDDDPLVILGNQGAGKTALLQYLGLRQPVDTALIWLPGEVVRSLSSKSGLNQVLEEALIHLMGPLPRDDLAPWVEMLRRSSRRVFLVDAVTPLTKAFLTQLQGYGRVIATQQTEDFSPAILPDPQAWKVIQIETWSPGTLHGLIQKYGPTRGASLRGMLRTFAQGFPQTPLWTLPLRHLDTDENLAITDAAQAIIQHRLGEDIYFGGGYFQELRRLAWDVYKNPRLRCEQSAYSHNKQDRLGVKACKKIIPWARNRHILREMANGEIRFLHPAIQLSLVAAYLVKIAVQSDVSLTDNSFLSRNIPSLLRGTPAPGQVMLFLVNLLWRDYQAGALVELVHQIAEAYLHTPLKTISPPPSNELLEAARPIGQIRRLAQFGGRHACSEHLQDVARNANLHSLEDVYQELLVSFFDVHIHRFLNRPGRLSKDELDQMGRVLTAFEPLPEDRAREVAFFLLGNPSLLSQPGVSRLITPTIRRMLDQFFISRTGHAWASAAEVQSAVTPLARQEILSPTTIQLTFWAGPQPSTYELVSALAARGDVDAALTLSEFWKSAAYPSSSFHFQLLLHAWTGSVFSFFPFIQELYLHDEAHYDPRWRRLCQGFVEYFGDDINLLLAYTDLFTIPPKLLDCLMTQGLRQQILTFDAGVALSRMLKQASTSETSRVPHSDRSPEETIPSLRTLTDRIAERLYAGDGIKDGILEYQSNQDVLFLFNHDQLPPKAQWEIANYHLLPQLPHPDIEFWALYTLLSPKHMSQEQLAVAILLAPCEPNLFDEETRIMFSDYSFLSEALQRRRQRCEENFFYE